MTCNLLDSYRELTGVEAKKQADKDGGEYAGPCPICGGKDRFRIWPNKGKGGMWWCRQCDRHGDHIAFWKEVGGITYAQACAKLGEKPEREKNIYKTNESATKKEKWAVASQRAQTIYKHSRELGEEGHPYLTGKNVEPCKDLRTNDQGQLVIPVMGINSLVQSSAPVIDNKHQIKSLQFIDASGNKSFMAGGQIKGGIFPVRHSKDGPIYLTEGLATGLSIAAAMSSCSVIVAFSVSNLGNVAEAIRLAFPDRNLIICADNDTKPDGSNPGFKGARKAALQTRALVAVPDLGTGEPCDFNDIHRKKGIGYVKEQIKAAHQPIAVEGAPQDQFENDSNIQLLPSFPQGVFGPVIEPILYKATKAFRAPIGVSVAGYLIMLATCAMGRWRISPKDGWEENPTLFLCVVGDSGSGKSPCMKVYLRPINECETKWFADWQKAMEEYEEQERAYKMDKNSNKPDQEKLKRPKKPVRRQVILNDSTPEAICDALDQSIGGILWQRDELLSLFQEADRYSKGDKGATRSMLLTCYDGDKLKINRSTGKNLDIPNACLSVFGGIQPGMLPACFSNQDRLSGLLQRFLFVHAVQTEPPLWTDETFDDTCRFVLADKVEKLLGQTPEHGRPEVLRFEPEAKQKWVDWVNSFAWTSYLGSQDVKTRLAKLTGQSLRLILLLHLSDWACGAAEEKPGPIPAETVIRGLRLTEWLKDHQEYTEKLILDGNSKTNKRAIETIDVLTAQKVLELGLNTMTHGIKPKELAELINEDLPEGHKKMTPHSIGRACARLGLKKSRTGESRFWHATQENLFQLRELIGPEKPPSLSSENRQKIEMARNAKTYDLNNARVVKKEKIESLDREA